jgi:hypothetical protein
VNEYLDFTNKICLYLCCAELQLICNSSCNYHWTNHVVTFTSISDPLLLLQLPTFLSYFYEDVERCIWKAIFIYSCFFLCSFKFQVFQGFRENVEGSVPMYKLSHVRVSNEPRRPGTSSTKVRKVPPPIILESNQDSSKKIEKIIV